MVLRFISPKLYKSEPNPSTFAICPKFGALLQFSEQLKTLGRRPRPGSRPRWRRSSRTRASMRVALNCKAAPQVFRVRTPRSTRSEVRGGEPVPTHSWRSRSRLLRSQSSSKKAAASLATSRVYRLGRSGFRIGL